MSFFVSIFNNYINIVSFILVIAFVVGAIYLIFKVFERTNSCLGTILFITLCTWIFDIMSKMWFVQNVLNLFFILLILAPVFFMIYFICTKVKKKNEEKKIDLLDEKMKKENEEREQILAEKRQKDALQRQSERLQEQENWCMFKKKYLNVDIFIRQDELFQTVKVNNSQLKSIYNDYLENLGISSNELLNKYLPEIETSLNTIDKKIIEIRDYYLSKNIGSKEETKNIIDKISAYKLKLRRVHEEYKSFLYGDIGENRVEEELKKFKGTFEYEYFRNIGIENGDRQADIDFIIVSKSGILLVEVKNFSDTNYNISEAKIHFKKDGMIERTYRSGKTDKSTKILDQCNFHLEIVKKFFSENNFSGIPLKSVIVIGNNKLAVENDNELLDVIRSNMLIRLIESRVEVMDTTEIISDKNYCHLIETIKLNGKEEKKREKVLLNIQEGYLNEIFELEKELLNIESAIYGN